jgi:predicted MFS family arabinose efflux permease
MQPVPKERANSAKPWFSLAVLTLVYAFNQADRYIMSALIEPIKRDLDLSDAGVGFLSGVSLAIFYIIAGVWIAVIADRSNRRDIVAGSLAIWSAMTAMSGVVRSYGALLAVRIGVGVGEAGGVAPAHAMISDLFPARARARALAIYGIGVSIGVALSSLGGWLSEIIGWRNVFFVLGIPGILLAIFIKLAMPEPERGAQDSVHITEKASLKDTCRYCLKQPFLMHQLWGSFVWVLASWGFLWWLPALLQRSHAMTTGEAGLMLGSVNGIGGTMGLIVSIGLMRFLEKHDPIWVTRAAAIMIVAAVIPALISVLATDTLLVKSSIWIAVTIIYMMFGPTFALLQNAVPMTMRTQISALALLLINVANLIVAPLGIGFASDLLAPSFGSESLRIAMIPLELIGFWGAYHFWVSGRMLHDAMRSAGTEFGESKKDQVLEPLSA